MDCSRRDVDAHAQARLEAATPDTGHCSSSAGDGVDDVPWHAAPSRELPGRWSDPKVPQIGWNRVGQVLEKRAKRFLFCEFCYETPRPSFRVSHTSAIGLKKLRVCWSCLNFLTSEKWIRIQEVTTAANGNIICWPEIEKQWIDYKTWHFLNRGDKLKKIQFADGREYGAVVQNPFGHSPMTRAYFARVVDPRTKLTWTQAQLHQKESDAMASTLHFIKRLWLKEKDLGVPISIWEQLTST